jgi:PAS domain S-box-containing protein
MRDYRRMTKRELIGELERRDADSDLELKAIIHELEVHQEEVRIQNAQLIEVHQVLEETAARYADLYDSAPIPYVTLDAAGLIVEVNLTGSSFFGAPRLRLINTPFVRFVADRSREAFYHHLKRCRSGESAATELDLEIGTRPPIAVELSSRAAGPVTTEPHYRTAILDLTARKRIEQELRRTQADLEARVRERTLELEHANLELEAEVIERRQLEAKLRQNAEELRTQHRRKDDFLAMLGHELRNPLAPIRSAVQVLKAAEIDRYQHQRARDVLERQVDHLVKLVDDLLDVSRISRGKIQMHKERIDLGQAIANAIDAVQPAVEASGHAFDVALAEGAIALEADPVRITQVIANLLQNAVKYTPRGGRIQLTTRREGDSAIVSVRDSGIGIERDALPHLFELFFQGEQALDRSRGGLGLGLALARLLVEMHGGSIEAKSGGRGKGSEFLVRLPTLPEASVGPDANARARADDQGCARRRILVVDDNVDAADSLAAVLESEGHEVRTAYEGGRALAIADEFDPEVVLLDIGLPHMDGYEVARRMRGAKKGEQRTLVAVTGYGEPEARRRSKEAGFDRHLLKPLGLDALHRLLSPGP